MKEAYKMEPHGPWIPLKGTGKHYCLGCGLIDLNNDFTSWAIKKGCNNKEHPQYSSMRKKYTKMD